MLISSGKVEPSNSTSTSLLLTNVLAETTIGLINSLGLLYFVM